MTLSEAWSASKLSAILRYGSTIFSVKGFLLTKVLAFRVGSASEGTVSERR